MTDVEYERSRVPGHVFFAYQTSLTLDHFQRPSATWRRSHENGVTNKTAAVVKVRTTSFQSERFAVAMGVTLVSFTHVRNRLRTLRICTRRRRGDRILTVPNNRRATAVVASATVFTAILCATSGAFIDSVS